MYTVLGVLSTYTVGQLMFLSLSELEFHYLYTKIGWLLTLIMVVRDVVEL